VRVLGISGSLRQDSFNSGLLRAAAELLPSGVELEVFDGLKEIPPYDADDDVAPGPAPVEAFREAIAGAERPHHLPGLRCGPDAAEHARARREHGDGLVPDG